MFAVISAILAVGVSCGSLRAGKGVSAQLCDIENEGTRKFLEEVDYTSDTAYVTSFARDYMDKYGANDRPLPVLVSWDEGTAAKVLISESADFKGALEVEAAESPAQVYNLKGDKGDGSVWLAKSSQTEPSPLSLLAQLLT